MPRLRYCTAEDAARRAFGATVARAGQDTIADALDADALLGTEDDREMLAARIEAVESEWDRAATPMRSVRVGSADAPEYFDAKGSPWPVKAYLDHQNIAPLDSNQGDFIETRNGRDDYHPITDLEGTAWTADYRKGVITVYRWPGAGTVPAFHRVRDRFISINYRLAAGGDAFNAGETTLTESLTASDTDTGTVTVADASRLPRDGQTVLLGGTEYAYVSGVDHETDEVEIAERGRRFTVADAHDAGDVIHFMPLEVRDAIAAKVAIDLAGTEDYTESLFDGEIDREEKIGRWRDEWQRIVGRYTTQTGYE